MRSSAGAAFARTLGAFVGSMTRTLSNGGDGTGRCDGGSVSAAGTQQTLKVDQDGPSAAG